MLKVLHVISGIDAQNGGPTRALLALASAQAKLGMSVRVVTTYRWPSGPANAPNFEAAGVPVTLIGPAWGALSWHPSIKQILRRLIAAVDVVHIHSMFEEIQHRAAKISRQLKKPYVMVPHGGLDPWAMAKSRLKKRLYLTLRLRRDLNNATVVQYCTTTEQRSSAAVGLTAPTLVVPNGIDFSEFESLPPRGAFRAKRPEIGDRRIVLFLGRIDPKKGLDLLIPAFARASIAGAVLVIAGPGNPAYEQSIRHMARREGIADRTIFTGMLLDRDRIEALVDADLFVMPSHVENFGISAVEALAAGLPILISDQVNIAESLMGIAGVAIVPTTVGALTDSLCHCLRDRAGLEVNLAHLPNVARMFSSDTVAKLWQTHYESLIRTSATK